MNASKITPATLSSKVSLALLGVLLALTPSAFGQSEKKVALNESMPTPTRIVLPRIDRNLAGERLEMTFWVDKSGQAYNIGCDDLTFDRSVIANLTLVLRYWKFEPARDANGKPVDRKVILPIRILSPKDGPDARVAFGNLK